MRALGPRGMAFLAGFAMLAQLRLQDTAPSQWMGLDCPHFLIAHLSSRLHRGRRDTHRCLGSVDLNGFPRCRGRRRC